MFAEVVAKIAVVDDLQCVLKREGEAVGALAIALQQMVGHAQRRFWAHAGQAAQCFDQLF